MKYNVKTWKGDKGLTWFAYDYRCERCGKKCKEGSRGWMTTQAPDFTELDLCVKCIRELLNSKIPYEEIKDKFYKPYECEIEDITEEKRKI